MLISFLKKEDEDGNVKSKFMGRGDIIFLLVLAGLIFGFWYWNKTTKERTYNHYAKCDALYAADSFAAAKDCYENRFDLSYRIDSLDSIGHYRVEKIDSILAVGL
jgi:hypothetical protein